MNGLMGLLGLAVLGSVADKSASSSRMKTAEKEIASSRKRMSRLNTTLPYVIAKDGVCNPVGVCGENMQTFATASEAEAAGITIAFPTACCNVPNITGADSIFFRRPPMYFGPTYIYHPIPEGVPDQTYFFMNEYLDRFDDERPLLQRKMAENWGSTRYNFRESALTHFPPPDLNWWLTMNQHD